MKAVLLFALLCFVALSQTRSQVAAPNSQSFLARCTSAARTKKKAADPVLRAFTDAANDILEPSDSPDCALYSRALEKAGGLEISGVALGNVSIVADFRGLTSLSLTNDGITSLSGIENLDGLLSLDLSDNAITDLTPLKSLKNLRVLKISNNKVVDLTPVGSMQHLRLLDAHLNQIRSLSVLNGLPELFHVELGENAISSVAGLDDFFAVRGSVDFNENLIEDARAIPEASQRSVNLSNNPATQIHNPPAPTLPILRPLMLDIGAAKLDRTNVVLRNRVVACGPRETPYSDNEPFGYQDLLEPCGTKW